MNTTEDIDTNNPAEVISYVQAERFRMLKNCEVNPPRAMLLSDFAQTAIIEKKLAIEKESNKTNQEMILAMQNALMQIKHDPYLIDGVVTNATARARPSLPEIQLVEGETFIGIENT